MNEKDKARIKGRGNETVSVRLNGEAELALNNGLEQTGLSRASYVRMAIIEKAERDKRCK
jgi:predicted DNA-binding protein